MLEISHCDVKEASVCDLRNTWDDRLCEVHHCPVTHELWLLVCSVRSPLALNCVSRWKPTLSTVCLLQTAAVAYLLQAWSRALGLFFFYSFLPYCIMYNLSYSGSWDSTLSPLHFNLKPLLSFCILHWLWSVYDTTQVCLCCVQLTDFDICGIGACAQKKEEKLSSFSLSLSLLSSLCNPLSVSQNHRIQCHTAKDQTSSFSSVSRSQLLMYKMKQCYKPNKNVFSPDSPGVNIWPLIPVNILHNYVWLWILHGASHWVHGKTPNCRV